VVGAVTVSVTVLGPLGSCPVDVILPVPVVALGLLGQSLPVSVVVLKVLIVLTPDVAMAVMIVGSSLLFNDIRALPRVPLIKPVVLDGLSSVVGLVAFPFSISPRILMDVLVNVGSDVGVNVFPMSVDIVEFEHAIMFSVLMRFPVVALVATVVVPRVGEPPGVPVLIVLPHVIGLPDPIFVTSGLSAVSLGELLVVVVVVTLARLVLIAAVVSINGGSAGAFIDPEEGLLVFMAALVGPSDHKAKVFAVLELMGITYLGVVGSEVSEGSSLEVGDGHRSDLSVGESDGSSEETEDELVHGWVWIQVVVNIIII